MRNPIFLKFQAKPLGITWKKLADGKKAMFDVTRQVRYADKFFTADKQPHRISTWPTTDEKPNDDTHNDDEDCGTPTTTHHDFLFSNDSPGDPNLRVPSNYSYVFRGNFREFVRVNFVSFSTQNNDQYWGKNVTKGTRCSDRTQWCAAINVLHDKNKIDNRVARAGRSDKFYHKYRVRFDKPKGLVESGGILPPLILRLIASGATKKVSDNSVYMDANFSDREIAAVPAYKVKRPRIK